MIFNIYKESGISSNHALNIFKRHTGVKKCGFAGTLDPFASGVLPIGVDKSTKLLTALSDYDKEYIVTAVFGASTDTMDLTGIIAEKTDCIPSIDNIQNIISSKFIGEIKQTPPVYSALKFNGKRLCDLARNNKLSQETLDSVALNKTRTLTIRSFDIIEQIDYKTIKFKVLCSKGTYIRKLIHDLAKDLNSLAFVSVLIRSAVGDIKIKDSIKILDIDQKNLERYNILVS